MRTQDSAISGNVIFFLFLTAACCFPVWFSTAFINQDGSAHVYSAYLLLHPAPLTALNTAAVPNSSGHWLMALLLMFFPALTVTKLMTTFTFGGIVASAGWIRFRTNGRDGLKTAMLIGAVAAFNWLWLVGFYNFLIGAVLVGFAVGVVARWQRKPGPGQIALLMILFLAAYFSHIISFCLMAGAVTVILWSMFPRDRFRVLGAIGVAVIPVTPLALIYRTYATGGGMSPVWRNLTSIWSPSAWLSQLRSADPLIIISRQSFPFIDWSSPWFALFTPLLWLTLALFLIAAASFSADRSRNDFQHRGAFGFLFAGTIAAALLAPDDFGLTNGSVLRERLFIVGLLFFIPVYRSGGNVILRRAAQAILVFILVFQVAALSDYARSSARANRDLTIASAAVPIDANVGAIVVVAEAQRFHAIPESMMTSYLGVGTGRIVWDNYEFGHRLFPVVMKSEDDRRFAFELTQVNVVTKGDPNRQPKLERLAAVLDSQGGRFDKLVVYGSDPQVNDIVSRGFELETELENVRVFRRR